MKAGATLARFAAASGDYDRKFHVVRLANPEREVVRKSMRASFTEHSRLKLEDERFCRTIAER